MDKYSAGENTQSTTRFDYTSLKAESDQCVCVFIKYATYAITLMEKRYTDTNHRCLLIQLLKTHTEQRLPQANPHFFHLMNIPSLNDAEKRRDLCRITCAVFIIGCHS